MTTPQDERGSAPWRLTLREQVNQPVRWRTVLMWGWAAYCILVVLPEWGEHPAAVMGVAAMMAAPVVAFRVWADGDSVKEAINLGIGMALLFPLVIVVIAYPLETLRLIVAGVVWALSSLKIEPS